MISVLKWIRGWLLLFIVSVFAGSAQSAPKKPVVLKEVIVTNYVGDDYARQDTPEYLARIVLRADGTAFYFGNPTYAPRTGQFRGTFAPSQFMRISKMLRGISFSTGSGKTNRVVTGDTRTEFDVLRADGARRHLVVYGSQHNPTLSALENITNGLSWKINWQRYVGVNHYNRDLSGVRGDVLRGSRDNVKIALGVPSAYVIAGVMLSLHTLAGKEVARGRSGKAGRFCLVAPPGNYYLVPTLPKDMKVDPTSAKQKVTVTANGFTDVIVETVVKGT